MSLASGNLPANTAMQDASLVNVFTAAMILLVTAHQDALKALKTDTLLKTLVAGHANGMLTAAKAMEVLACTEHTVEMPPPDFVARPTAHLSYQSPNLFSKPSIAEAFLLKAKSAGGLPNTCLVIL